MPRTKHLFITLFLLIVTVVFVFLYVSSGEKESVATVETTDRFAEGEVDYDVLYQEERDIIAAREEFISKLERGEGRTVTPHPSVTEEVVVPTLPPEDEPSNERTIETLPTFSFTIAGVTRQAVAGSYCWGSVCRTTLLNDLPYPAYPVASSTPLSFSVDASEEPESIIIFLKDVTTGQVVHEHQLTVGELQSGEIQLPQIGGTFLLLITGSWPGGEDVVGVIKIQIV